MTLNERLINEILHAAGRLVAARDAMCAAYGLTSTRLHVLKAIHRLPVAFTVSALSRSLGLARQTLQPIVHELERFGYLELAEDYRNRRASRVYLTDWGKAQLQRVIDLEERWIRDLTCGFEERDLAQTEWVIRQMRERLSEIRDDYCAGL